MVFEPLMYNQMHSRTHETLTFKGWNLHTDIKCYVCVPHRRAHGVNTCSTPGQMDAWQLQWNSSLHYTRWPLLCIIRTSTHIQ